MPEGYEQWEFDLPLLAREFANGKGRHTKTWIPVCVVVHGGIGGHCVVVISCWNLLILPYMLRSSCAQLIPLSCRLNKGFGYVR